MKLPKKENRKMIYHLRNIIIFLNNQKAQKNKCIANLKFRKKYQKQHKAIE